MTRPNSSTPSATSGVAPIAIMASVALVQLITLYGDEAELTALETPGGHLHGIVSGSELFLPTTPAAGSIISWPPSPAAAIGLATAMATASVAIAAVVSTRREITD